MQNSNKKSWFFEPNEKITAFELATILKAWEVSIADELYQVLGPNLKKHFMHREPKTNDDGQ
jgi:hypothetical protein